MSFPTLAALSAAALSFVGGAANAQMIVHDPTSYAKLISQAQTALDQLNELKSQVHQGRQLFDSLNTASAVNDIAPALNATALRRVLPDVETFAAAGRGEFSDAGALGARAQQIRESTRLYTAAPDDAVGSDLEQTGVRAARDAALGEAVAAAASARLTGLSQLQTAVAAAPNARAVLDLQARISAEQAMIANDQMRLQGIAIAQAAEDRLQRQRDGERARAESAARMAQYRRSFE